MPTDTHPLPVADLLSPILTPPGAFEPLIPWLPHLSLLSQTEEEVLLAVTDPTLSDCFTPSLEALLEKALQQVFSPSLLVTVSRSSAVAPRAFSPNPNMRFHLFHTGPSNRLAFAAAKAVAAAPGTTYNPLFIHSALGLGKTHLLHALFHELHLSHPGIRVLAFPADQFVQLVQRASDTATLPALHRSLTDTDVFLLDDIHRFMDRPQAAAAFLDIFNHLHTHQGQIIVSADRAPSLMTGLPAPLVSRLQWGLVVHMDAPTPEMRQQFICEKSAAFSLSLADEIVAYLSTNTFGPIRELEGILNSLRGRATLLHESIDLSLVQEVVLSSVSRPNHTVTIPEIEAFICERFGLSRDDLFSKSRARSIAYPRQVAMFLAHTLTNASLEEIGRYFGGRDHSTVKHGCEKIKRLAQTDPQLRALISSFRRSAVTV